MVYEKSLRLSTYAMSGGMMTTGQITNHMSVDAQSVMFSFFLAIAIWATPLKVCYFAFTTDKSLQIQLSSPSYGSMCLAYDPPCTFKQIFVQVPH